MPRLAPVTTATGSWLELTRVTVRPALTCGHALAGPRLRAVAAHLRHAPRAHAAAGQAGGGARPAGAAASARGASPDRSRLGDAAAACARRLRVRRGLPRSAPP